MTCVASRWPCPAWRRSTATASISGWVARDSSGPIPSASRASARVIRTDIAVLFVGDEAEKQALLLGEPGIFFTTPGYDGWPLVMLRLAEVDVARLTELVTDAWRMRAPGTRASEPPGR